MLEPEPEPAAAPGTARELECFVLLLLEPLLLL